MEDRYSGIDYEGMDGEEFDLDYETTYEHCLADNPYWFIPDLECNTEAELLSWRHALFAVKQGTFECPEHFFWKVVDNQPDKQEISGILDECDALSMMGADDGKIVIHGHNTPWGMGISAFSDKVNVWNEYPDDKWLLELAESDVTDAAFIATIKEHVDKRNKEFEEWKRSRHYR